jgi:hypothetical protein
MVLILALSIAMIVSLMGCEVFASPQLPCEFYGTVAITGTPVPAGTMISAYVNGVKQGSIGVKEPGVYGGVGTFDERLIVLSGENDFSGGAPSITFRIGEKTADQTATYTPGMSKELDLSIGAGIGPLSSNATPSPQAMAAGTNQGTPQILNTSGATVQPTLVPPPAAIALQTSAPAAPSTSVSPVQQPQAGQVNTTSVGPVNSSSPAVVQTPLPVVAPPTVAAKFPLNVSSSPANQTIAVPTAVQTTAAIAGAAPVDQTVTATSVVSTTSVPASPPQMNQSAAGIPVNNTTAGIPVDNLSVTISFPSGAVVTP